MPRPLFDSEYIFGIHEPGGERHMLEAGKPGWVLFTEEVGHDPNNHSGKNFTRWSNQNLGIICRINNGYGSAGTIPNSQNYADFAQRVANYVRASHGCKIWLIGNEMNYEVERPPASPTRSATPAPAAAPSPASTPSSTDAPTLDAAPTPEPPAQRPSIWGRVFGPVLHFISDGMGETQLFDDNGTESLGDPFGHGNPDRFSALNQPTPADQSAPVMPASAPARSAALSNKEVITPQLYADCYRRCRDAIHAIPGHEDDQVIIGSVAPWNNQTRYPGNLNGDWIRYFQDILNILGPDGCDGISIHAYTHGADPNLIHSSAKMDPPFQNYHFHFRTYQDFMNAIPVSMRHLPVYLTEADENDPWLDRNIGWVKRAYGEIDHWNKQAGNQQIRSMILYRWPNIDRWVIEGKQGVIDDFREALRNPYRWQVKLPAPLSLRTGNRIKTLDILNLRRSPGHTGQPANDLRAQLPKGTILEVLDGQYRTADTLTWWNVRIKDASSQNVDGWIAQFAPTGLPVIEKTTSPLTSLSETIIDASAPTTPGTGSGSSSSSTDGQIRVGGGVRTLDIVRMRKSPGTSNKPITDTVDEVPVGRTLKVVGGPQSKDGLTWWEATGTGSQGSTVRGWMAESVNGNALLEAASAPSTGGSGPVVPTPPTTSGKFAVGDKLRTQDIVKLRRSPGYRNKPISDVVANIEQNMAATVVGGPTDADGLTWWRVVTTASDGSTVNGWMAESIGDSILLAKDGSEGNGRDVDKPAGKFTINQQVRTLDIVRMRKTPGFFGKSAADIVDDIPFDNVGKIVGGPQNTDGLTWWRVESKNDRGQTVNGWMAESLANGKPLLEASSSTGGSDSGSGTGGTEKNRFAQGDTFKTANVVRVRRTPGYFDKPSSDTIAGVFEGTLGKVLGGPVSEDDLIWWRVETRDPAGATVTGWVAQDDPNGIPLLQKVDSSSVPTKPPEPKGAFEKDELVYAADDLKVRQTPGHRNKPDNDVLGGFAKETTLNIIEGPQSKDDLPWWRVGGISAVGPNGERVGWVAGELNGNKLVTDAPKLPGTNVPNKDEHIYLGPPTDRVFTIGQLWGENPQFYKRFTPGGVPLRGHNGVDWNTPTGTNLLAVDSGTVIDTQFDPNGFGNYVVIGHSWGHSIYAHMSSVAVRLNQGVGRGGFIGKSGSTGVSTGPHLHFAIRIKGYNVADGWGGFSDPLPYIPREFVILPHYVLPTQPRSAAAAAASPAISRDPSPAATPEPADVPNFSQRLAPSGITEDIP